MKNQTIKIKHKNGHDIVKGNGDYYRLRLSSGELVTGTMQPTFGYKLRRFCRRFAKTTSAKLAGLAKYSFMYYERPLLAAEIPYIGLEEERCG